PVAILGSPTQRATDGLALSSRNAYLSQVQRRKAGRLNVILKTAAAAVAAGADIERVEAEAREALAKAGFDRVDYLEVRGADDLARQGPGPAERPSRVFVAAWLGKTRLIDNMAAE